MTTLGYLPHPHLWMVIVAYVGFCFPLAVFLASLWDLRFWRTWADYLWALVSLAVTLVACFRPYWVGLFILSSCALGLLFDSLLVFRQRRRRP